MSSVAKEKIKVYETVLSSPGMADKCKVVLQLSRQNILLLSRLIETGLNSSKENPDELISLLSNESKEELDTVVPELLKKGGLTEFYEKLKTL